MIALIDKAAPPLASPSNLVIITPVMSNSLLKLSATLTASCPVIESTTNKISIGLTDDLIDFNSSISTSSICSLPAVSKITISFELEFANLIDSFAIFVTSLQSSIVNTGTSTDLPTTCNCFIAAGL